MSDGPGSDPVLAALSQLRWLGTKGAISGGELEILKWELFSGGAERVKPALNKIQHMVWLREQGTITDAELEALKRPLLTTLGPVFPPEPAGAPAAQPPPTPPSSAGQPTTRLAPQDDRWRYLTVAAALGDGPGATTPEALQLALDQYGADGWELAACLPQGETTLLIFKRRV